MFLVRGGLHRVGVAASKQIMIVDGVLGKDAVAIELLATSANTREIRTKNKSKGRMIAHAAGNRMQRALRDGQMSLADDGARQQTRRLDE